jgi:DNA-binding NtrC family response regulator
MPRMHPILAWIHENSDRAVRPLWQVEQEAIMTAMILCRGKQALAARRLGISRETLNRKLKIYREMERDTLF